MPSQPWMDPWRWHVSSQGTASGALPVAQSSVPPEMRAAHLRPHPQPRCGPQRHGCPLLLAKLTFNQTGCPCPRRGSDASSSCSTALSTCLGKHAAVHKRIPTSMVCEQCPAGGTVPCQEEERAALSPFPSPTYGGQASWAGASSSLHCLDRTHHRIPQVWAQLCSRTWWQENVCSLFCSVPVPQTTRVQRDRDTWAARAALPQLIAPPGWPCSISPWCKTGYDRTKGLHADAMAGKSCPSEADCSFRFWVWRFFGRIKHLVEVNDIC